MKKTLLAILTIGLLTSVPVIAQTMMDGREMGPGMMNETQKQTTTVPDQEYLRHMQARMMNNNYGKMGGYNMMGSYAMMPMMGGGYGTPPCVAGESYGKTGHHAWMPMMGNYGIMPMMAGPGMMHNLGDDNYKKYQEFANETRELRRKLHDLMFEYSEARWNPDTTVGELNEMAGEINKLRGEIQDQLPQ